MNGINVKKKIINWIILLAILTLVLFGVKWAEGKRDQWLDKQKTETE